MSYTLDHLFIFSAAEIEQILAHFNNPISPDPIINRYNAIALSANNLILDPNDLKYVSSPYFYELMINRKLDSTQIRQFVDSLSTTKLTVQERGYPIVNGPAIPEKIPWGIELYTWENKSLVCGPKTDKIIDQLKIRGGIFNETYKCWEFPGDAPGLSKYIETMKLKLATGRFIRDAHLANGEREIYQFTVTQVVTPEKLIIELDPKTNKYRPRSEQATITPEVPDRVRTITKRKNGEWIFIGYPKFRSYERIEFDE
jgi:hypothetical protein